MSQAALAACATGQQHLLGFAVYNMEPSGSPGKRENPTISWTSLSVLGGGWEGFPWQKGVSKALKEVSVK